MSAVEKPADSDKTSVRAFRVNVSGGGARRSPTAHTPRPGGPTGKRSQDQSQGPQLGTLQKLARYWETEYDWRKVEARLNALPNFVTEIDGLDIHFIHVRSKHENALPLIVTHGWPGSVIEQLKIIDPLDQSNGTWRKRSGCFPSGHPVDPGLRVLGQADDDRLGPGAHRPRLGRADEAPWIHEVRGPRRRLGRDHHRPDGARRGIRNCSASTPTCRACFRPT